MSGGGSESNGESGDSVTKLACPICLENYRRPKLLPCFHTFYQSCLQGVASSSPSFPCPSCRSLVLLPPGGIPALQAQQDHILRGLTEGREADLVSLEAQLSSRPEEDVTRIQMKAELTQDMPMFHAEYTTTAVNPVQSHAFVGTLAPLQQMSGPEGTVTPPVLPSPVQGKVSLSAAVSAKEPDLTMHRRDCLPSSGSLVKVGRKKPPREFSWSKNPKSYVLALCPISQSRLWVIYVTAMDSSLCLKLFDDEGQVLTRVENPRYCDGLVPITDDVILAWSCYNSSVQLITPDGSLGTHDVGSKVEVILSSAMNDNHYLK